jgi:hypothetical protein
VVAVSLEPALFEKMEHNARRYPVALAKGNARKYTELGSEGK